MYVNIWRTDQTGTTSINRRQPRNIIIFWRFDRHVCLPLNTLQSAREVVLFAFHVLDIVQEKMYVVNSKLRLLPSGHLKEVYFVRLEPHCRVQKQKESNSPLNTKHGVACHVLLVKSAGFKLWCFCSEEFGCGVVTPVSLSKTPT